MTHNGKSFGETPSTGRTFGWERRLQITISWNRRCHESSKTYMTHKLLAAYLLDLGQAFGRECAEYLYAYTASVVATFPDIGELLSVERDVAFLRDVI